MSVSRISGKAVIAIFAAMSLATACTKDSSEEDRKEQELRYFNIYAESRYPGAELTEEGFYYIEHKAGTGVTPGNEDWMLVNHVGYEIPEDKVFVSYIKNVVEDNNLDSKGTALYGPYKMQNGSQNEGFTKGVSMMKEGGKATFLFTSDLGYGNNGNSKVGAYASLKYEVELMEVIPDMDAYERAKIDAYLDTIPEYVTIQDSDTESEMYLIMDYATDGQLIENDSAVSLAYKGQLLDGRVFDEAGSDEPLEFTMGNSEFITGWDLALTRLREGEKARLVIPYPLAYGILGETDPGTGLRVIPPYETLLFEIEVLKVGGETEDNNEHPVEQ
jgi:FKBP-type peptidyl-prolyl cis-trans isomerase